MYPTVEIPLQRKQTPIGKIKNKLIPILIPIFFIFMVLLQIFQSFLNLPDQVQNILILTMMSFSFIGIPICSLTDAILISGYLENVCKITVKGEFVGYAEEWKAGRNGGYMDYIPKYKIFINDRYEIRTLYSFGETDEKYECQQELLANPDGCEIILRNSRIFPREDSLVCLMILIVFILLGVPGLLSVI